MASKTAKATDSQEVQEDQEGSKTQEDQENSEIQEDQEGSETPEESPIDRLIKEYTKGYPKERVFHITSDLQVFLSAGLADAKRHQKSIDPDKQVVTINVR